MDRKRTAETAIFAIGVAAFAIGAATPAYAADAEAAASAQAKVFSPITIAAGDDLNFGTFVTDGNGGIIDMAPNGSVTCYGFSACLDASSAASFSVTGTANQTVHISGPGNFFLSAPGGEQVEVGNVVYTGDNVSSVSYFHSNGLLDGDGSLTFKVSGSLWAPVGTPNAEYSGTFTVNVDYL